MSDPRRNRVDPWGRLIADPARGSLMGNRGVLHDEHGQIRREHQLKRWIICRLEFKGRHREIMRPGRWTELFFLDEATALAAGHRPCAECQRSRFNEFREAWLAGNPEAAKGEGRISAVALDEVLHRDRLAAGEKVTFSARCGDLPDGVIVGGVREERNAPHLLWDGRFWEWHSGGYEHPVPARRTGVVEVLTPRSTVNALASGFTPAVPVDFANQLARRAQLRNEPIASAVVRE